MSLLTRQGISFDSLREYLKPNSFHDNHDKASEFLRKLYDASELDFFKYSGIELLKVKGGYLLHYIKQILYCLELLECIFDAYPNIDKLWIPQSNIFSPKTAGPIAPFAVRALVDVVRLVGKQRRISVSILPYNKQQFNSKQTRLAIRQAATMLFEQALHFINFVTTLTRKPQELKIFVIDRWRSIKPFIEKMQNVELIMMERKEIKNMGWQVWRKRARFYHPKNFFNSSIQRIARDKQAEFRSQWQKLGSQPKFSEIFNYQDISFWSIIKQVCDDIIVEHSQDMVCEIEGIKQILNRFSINRVLLFTTTKDHFYITAKLASQLKIPSIELQHGLVGSETTFVYFSPIRASYFAAYGRLTKEILIRDSSNDPQRIIEVGSPRFDYYLTKHDQQGLEILRARFKLDPTKFTVLFIPLAVRNPIKPRDCTSYEAIEKYQMLDKLRTGISGIQIILKLRPTNINTKFHRQAVAEILKDRVALAQYEDMKSLLYLSDLVISCKSTVSIEAMISGKPVILYMVRGKFFQFELFEKAGAIKIARNSDELLMHVRSLILDKKARENLINNANIFLKKYYQFDGKSSERIIDLLNKGVL